MSQFRQRGRIFRYSKESMSGTIRLDNGDLVELPRSAVIASGILDVGLGDHVSIYVNARLHRSVATDVMLDRTARTQPKAAKKARRVRSDEAAVTERIPGEVRILLVGRTGVGKSSTINSLLGADVAPVGDFEPETASVHIYRGRIGSLRVMVVDTPGLCDDRPDKGNDDRYIEHLSITVGAVDLMLFVTTLDESRVRSDEIRCLDLLTSKFGYGIWDNAVVALTRADFVKKSDYPRHLKGRTQAIRARLEEVSPSNAHSIPLVPVSNRKARTPDRQRWLPNLWIAVLERLASEAFAPLALAMTSRVELEADEPKTVRSAPARIRDDGTISRPAPKGARGTKGKTNTPAPVSGRSGPSSGGPGPQSGPRPARKTQPQAVKAPTTGAPTIAPPSTSKAIAVIQPTGSVITRKPVFTPSLEDVLPEEPSASSPSVKVERVTETIRNGIKVTQTEFSTSAGSNPIVVNGDQAFILQTVTNERAPGLLSRVAKTAALWLAKKALALIGS